MEVELRESCFAENLLERLHGAEAEAVETSPKSRQQCCRVDGVLCHFDQFGSNA